MAVVHSLFPEERDDHTVDDTRVLGEILVDRGALAEDELEQALVDQTAAGVPLGDYLSARGIVSDDAIARAVADQRGLGFVDLIAEPADPKVARPEDLQVYLDHCLIPWRKVGKIIAYATSDPDLAQKGLAKLETLLGMAFVVVATPKQIQQATLDMFGDRVAENAAMRTAPELSVRSLDTARQRVMLAMGLGSLGAVAITDLALVLMGAALLFLSIATTLTRLAAMIAGLFERRRASASDAVVLAARRPLPTLSVLIPLYDEGPMIPRLVEALDAVDYPRDRLDVKLLLEARDQATRDVALSMELPPWIDVLILPEGGPRTKPRALNIALDFCRGEIVGVLDAEDKPAPDQFRIVAHHLQNAPREVAAAQCQLSYFNAGENWITRCFQIEYAIWFDVLLRGWERIGFPIPLGGTSVYFRKQALQDLGGWDAHNVTEDADLGMRLARKGMTCAVIRSTTKEEANCRFLPWIRQRSRWLKGYMITWLSHMRRPLALWRELGPIGFLGFQVLFVGGAASYLAMPLFWFAMAMSLLFGQSVYGALMPDWAVVTLAIALASGQLVMLSCATLALARRRALGLLWCVPTLVVYWTMGAIAAWKALIELGFAPYYWDKTRHGVSRFCDQTERQPMVAEPTLARPIARRAQFQQVAR